MNGFHSHTVSIIYVIPIFAQKTEAQYTEDDVYTLQKDGKGPGNEDIKMWWEITL